MPAKIALTDEQAVLITASPLSDTGVVEPDQIGFALTSGDGEVVFPAYDAKGALLPNACYFVSGSPGAEAVVTATDQTDSTIADTVTIAVSHAKATHLGINAGVPFAKTDVPPAPTPES